MSLTAIGIVSWRLQESIRFYELLTGARFQKIGGADHYEGKSGSLRLMIDSSDLIKTLDPQWKKPLGGSGVILCFKQKSPSEADRLYWRIVKAGFQSKKKPWDAFWGQRYASVLDPCGYQADIFANLPSDSSSKTPPA